MPASYRRRSMVSRFRLEPLDDRCVPAVVSEFTFPFGFPTPAGAAAGPGGMWFTDPGTNRVGRVGTDGTITEIPLPTADSDPKGITLGPDSNLWFTEFGTDKIGKLNPTTFEITEYALTTGAGPTDIVAGPDGKLWYTETASGSIGAITTAGVPASFSVQRDGSQPFGIAAGSDGRLWFTEFAGDKIGAITTAGVVSEFDVGAATSPTGITSGPDNNLWFGSSNPGNVGRITTAGSLTVFSGLVIPDPTAEQSVIVADIVTGPDSALWFVDANNDLAGRITTDGTLTNTFDTTANSVPTAIAKGSDGNLYFTEPGTGSVTQLTTGGTQTSFTERRLTGTSDTAADTNGNIWFTAGDAAIVGRVNPTTGAVVTFSLPNGASDPKGITLGPDGNLWFTLFGADKIVRVTPAGEFTFFADGISVGAGPSDIVTGPDGKLWFTESAAGMIGQLNPTDGKITEFPVPTEGSQPFGIAAGSDGRLWFTENGTNKIGAITTAGVVTEFAVPGDASGPLGIAAGSDGALWFTQFTSSEIGRITTAGTVTEFATPTAVSGPAGIVSGGDGVLYFTNAATGTVGRITTGGTATELTDGGSGGSAPSGITVLPNGNLAFGEATLGQIGVVTFAADVSVTITDGQTTIVAGNKLTYTVVVTNAAGSDPLAAAKVSVPVPTGLTGVTWTAAFAGGATGAASGTGAINESVGLPAGGTVTYSFVGTPTTAGTLTTTATVAGGVPDGTPANNAVTDTTTVTPSALSASVQFAAGTGTGTANKATLYNADGTVRYTLTPFAAGFTGSVRTATADFNADGVADLVVGTGPGIATSVRILDGKSQAVLFDVAAFEPSFTGGVYVAAGDITGDGVPDLLITPDEGGGPRVDMYTGGATFTKTASFFGIDDPNFRGGARASTGDFNGDGRTDLIVAAGFGGGPRVAVYNGTTVASSAPVRLVNDFFAFEQALRNGVFIGLGDVDADGKADVIAGGGPGGGPRVTVFSATDLLSSGGGTLTQLANFFAGDQSNRGGVRIAVKNLDADSRADLIVGSGTGAGNRVTAYLGKNVSAGGTPTSTLDFDAFPGTTGGVFVG